jgi:DNA-binding response OmpR family regulator
VSCAGLTLDEPHQSVIVSQRAIALSGIEFRLLRYFMLHAGQVLSKGELVEHLYDNDSQRDSNVIEVYVNHLRNKLGDGYIKTRRGQGYVFGALD